MSSTLRACAHWVLGGGRVWPGLPGPNRPLTSSAPLNVHARSYKDTSRKYPCMACACVPLPAERPPETHLKHTSRRLGRSPSPALGSATHPFRDCLVKKAFAWSSASALFFRAARRRTGPLVPVSWRVSGCRNSTRDPKCRRLALRDPHSGPSCSYLGLAGSRVRGHGLRARALRRA